MQAVLINTNNKSDFKLITDLAKKIGANTKVLNKEEMEDFTLGELIEEGRNGEYVDKDKFLKKLKNTI